MRGCKKGGYADEVGLIGRSGAPHRTHRCHGSRVIAAASVPHAKAQAVPCAEIADKAKSYLDQSERYWQMGGAENLRAADITIKRGLIGNLTQEMIAQAESKVRDLQG